MVDYRTRMQDDREKITNIVLALMNEGYYLFKFGSFLLSTTHTEGDIDSLLGGLERGPAQPGLRLMTTAARPRGPGPALSGR